MKDVRDLKDLTDLQPEDVEFSGSTVGSVGRMGTPTLSLGGELRTRLRQWQRIRKTQKHGPAAGVRSVDVEQIEALRVYG